MPSKAELKVRERLAKNGRNAANNNAGIRTGGDLHLCEMLLADLDQARADLRRLAIKQHVLMASGGGYVNNGFSCATCKGEWPQEGPEAHALTCPLAE